MAEPTGIEKLKTVKKSPSHECDLFLLTSHQSYTADRALPTFAHLGARNVHGWGIGWYRGQQARVIRRATPATDGGSPAQEFLTAVEAVSSPVLLGHLRLTSRGATRQENNHPFTLRFLGYEWLLIHNGTARRNDLVPVGDQMLTESNNDTARVFEFLCQRIIDYADSNPKHSLIEACRKAFAALLDADPEGSFNLILSNGNVTFALIHWRPFYLLRREKDHGDAALLSTIRLTGDEEWLTFERLPNKRAKMLAFSGPSLLLNVDI
ncbi:MAG: hypothetical protein GXY83_22515 [Rhodopirellula sp.]|nr:hypothetical protein [Rhodopirellula sp.]